MLPELYESKDMIWARDNGLKVWSDIGPTQRISSFLGMEYM